MRTPLLYALTSCVSILALSVSLAGPAKAHHVSAGQAQSVQSKPVELGTSGGSREHIVIKNRLYCYTGTLGALVEKNNDYHILSNNHVLAKENGLLNLGSGEDGQIIQPGILDLGQCTISSGDSAQQVGDLSFYVPIEFGKGKSFPDNYVDAALAVTDGSDVDSSGSILGIGPTTGNSVSPEAAVGMKVQKTGRTTGHTFGTVLALEVSVDVKYESGTARFFNQLRIRHACDTGEFSAAGDSGSQIVTVPVSGDPDSVGLLFAGGGADTFANPIEAVLDPGVGVGATLVGSPDGDTPGAMDSDYESVAAACVSEEVDSGSGNPGRGGGGRPFDSFDPAGLAVASAVKARNSERIFALPDVVGHGVGFDADGEAVIEIYVRGQAKREANRPLPVEIEGVAVRIVETGDVRAY